MSLCLPVDTKNVVLSVSRMCFSEDSLVEVLRTAIGLASGRAEHKVSVVFWGDGVVQSLREHYVAGCKPYLISALTHKVEFFVDATGMSLRGLKIEQMADGFKSISREELLQKLHACDSHLRM